MIPDKYYYKIMQYERYIGIAFMLIILFGALDVPLAYLSSWLFKGLYYAAAFPFKFF